MASSGDEGPVSGEVHGSPDSPSSRVYYLENALWRRLDDATDPKDMADAWLGLQCRMIAGAERGIVMIGASPDGPFDLHAAWPDGAVPGALLSAAADLAVKQGRGIVHRPHGRGRRSVTEPVALAYPFPVGGELRGVVAVELSGSEACDPREVMRQLQWGSAWMRAASARADDHGKAETLDRLSALFRLIASSLEHDRFEAATTAVVGTLATELGCDRVSIGFARRGHVQVSAISHSTQFGKRMNLIRALGAAMDEAVDQQVMLAHPLDDDRIVMGAAHRTLAETGGAGAILTLPLSSGERYFGALTCERPADAPFDAATVELLEAVACMVGPILDEKRRNDRWLIVKAFDTVELHGKRLLGPRHFGHKLVAFVLAACVLFFAIAEGDYRIGAEARLEGRVRRVVSAPIEGYVQSEHARAGDRVKAGQVLARLDDRDLRLELRGWSAVSRQRLRELDKAMADGNRAGINVIEAQIEQAEAQQFLIEAQLARTTLTAPFDGLVVSGDLSQQIGSAIQRGQVLFEITPLQAYRVVLKVDERSIDDIAVGQTGRLVLFSLPEHDHRFKVERVTPVAEANEGRNYFVVDAALEDIAPQLRPGMEGVGKIQIDRRKLAWIWSHDLVDFFRLQIWRWWP